MYRAGAVLVFIQPGDAVIDLPWPPTVNHYYTIARGRKILSKEGRAFKKYAVTLMELAKVPKLAGPRFAVSISARPPDRRKRDLDNILKPILDSLCEYGAITDDSKIDDLRIQRYRPVKDGFIHVLISGYGDE